MDNARDVRVVASAMAAVMRESWVVDVLMLKVDVRQVMEKR